MKNLVWICAIWKEMSIQQLGIGRLQEVLGFQGRNHIPHKQVDSEGKKGLVFLIFTAVV